MVYFHCELCGKEKEEPLAWFKKRKKHFCSRECANKSRANPNKLSRKEYEKEYWNRPENKVRRKEMSKKAHINRMANLGESYVKAMLSRCKARAILKGLDFNLTIDDIYIPEYCPILNVKLELNEKQGGGDTSPALDRIDSSKGYVKGNIQVISSKANRIKTNATTEEIGLVYSYLLAHCQYTGGLKLADFQAGKTL
jgi:hypothetical protein